MSGGSISCGGFIGDDKSGSAYSGVLEALESLDGGRFAEQVGLLRNDLAAASEFVLIPPECAESLLLAVSRYRLELEIALGAPAHPFDAMEQDEILRSLDPVEAKWGKGPGWRYYCVLDLQRALSRSSSSGEPVCIAFD